jgi:hypothetical protein
MPLLSGGHAQTHREIGFFLLNSAALGGCVADLAAAEPTDSENAADGPARCTRYVGIVPEVQIELLTARP